MLPTTVARRLARFTLVLINSLILVACGGGGGGGSSSSSSSSGGSTGGRGGFTLSATSASFEALRNRAAPNEVRIAVRVTGSAVAAVGAAFVNQSPPTWLQVGMEGSVPNLTLVLGIAQTNLPAASYSTTVTVGTADSSGAVLTSQEVRVTFDLIEGMTVTATPLNHSFVFGSSRTTGQVTVTVGAPGKSWTITSNRAWLPVPGATQQGDGVLTLTLDGANTGAAVDGTATAELVVQNTAEPVDRHVLTVSAALVAPRPRVSPATVVLGGASGLDDLLRAVDVSLDTGTNTYPWSISFEAPQSPGWLVSDVASGNANDTLHSTVTLAPGTSIGAPGNYSATAHFDAVVAGQSFRTSVPVTLRWHGQRLVASQNGVHFSSFPSRPQPAARTLKVRGSRDIANVPWTATSNQAWLTVTPNGVTGGDLTLQADPAGLATNTVHLAEVTLASNSANVERPERIRVGFWVGATNPAPVSIAVPGGHSDGIVMNPVLPHAYGLSGGALRIYNLYTGAEVASLPGLRAGGSVEVNSDGSAVYVANLPDAQVLVIDPASAQLLDTYQSTNGFGNPVDSRLRFFRTNGYPLLMTPFGDLTTVVYDLEQEAPVPTSRNGIPLFQRFDPLRTVSQDGRRLFTTHDATTTETVDGFVLTFGVFGGRTLQVNSDDSIFTFGGPFTRQMCVSASGTRLYTHNLGELQEISLELDPPRQLRTVPSPTSIHAIDCNWNGRVYAGLGSVSTGQPNVLMLDAAGNNVGSFTNGPDNSSNVVHQLSLSGDSRRMIATRVRQGGGVFWELSDVPE